MIFCPFLKSLCPMNNDDCLNDDCLKTDDCLKKEHCPMNNNVYLKDVCQSSVCLVLVYTYVIIGILLITLGWYMMEQTHYQSIFEPAHKNIFEQAHYQNIFEPPQQNNKCILEEQECSQMFFSSSNYLVISILMLFLFAKYLVDSLSNMFMHFMKFLMFATFVGILVVCSITLGYIIAKYEYF